MLTGSEAADALAAAGVARELDAKVRRERSLRTGVVSLETARLREQITAAEAAAIVAQHKAREATLLVSLESIGRSGKLAGDAPSWQPVLWVSVVMSRWQLCVVGSLDVSNVADERSSGQPRERARGANHMRNHDLYATQQPHKPLARRGPRLRRRARRQPRAAPRRLGRRPEASAHGCRPVGEVGVERGQVASTPLQKARR